MSPLTVTILGSGRAGAALARECEAAPGVRLVGRWNRSPRPDLDAEVVVGGAPPPALLDVDVLLLAVTDSAVPELASTLRPPPRTVVLHLSGAADPGLLAGLGSGVPGGWHPLQAFSTRSGGQPVPPYAVALEGADEAVARGRQLAALLGHPAVLLPPGGRAAYHAAAVLASNCLVALEASALRVMQSAGVAEEDGWQLLWPLVAGTLENLRAGPRPGSLTGPVARGDEATVRRNLAALQHDPPAAAIYLALSIEALSLAGAQGLDPSAQRAILDALGCAPAQSD